MSARIPAAFETIRTEGALLPSDILVRLASGDQGLGGLEPDSYHLVAGEKIGEATNRAWNRLQAAWANFQSARKTLPENDSGTKLTRERWLLPLFQLLDYGRLQSAKAEQIGEKTYAISHSWQQTPIHLVGCNVSLDERSQSTLGRTRSSPHSLVQEFLNRSELHLWGIVSNGLRLRLLRDNISLTRQAYVEFDLEAMMSGEAYSDFVLLWLLLHQSRFESERPEFCQLEQWTETARTEGVRILDGLSESVQKAIEELGRGFLAHPENSVLRQKLRSGMLDKQDFYRQLLRLVYRLIFLFVADDRDLLLKPDADPVARKRYREHYATTRLRRLATRIPGSRHSDLYRSFRMVMGLLSVDGCQDLGLPALGSFLFSSLALTDLNDCELANLHLLGVIRFLAFTQKGGSRRPVDYRNLGAEELGSIYESLLELHPQLNTDAASFELDVAAGSERKKTGSYYTATSLVSCLLDSALDPVLERASNQADAEGALLQLKVVDPACGSGHFLIAAAHRIGRRLASIRTGEEEPPPAATRHALRQVIGHCIYGVDVNPMAVELCKVSLWMEALEPGKPLNFLEHRIQPGNSLLGATPDVLDKGIPDEAFTAIEGDDPEICREFKRINRDERNSQGRLIAATTEPWLQLGNLAAGLANIDIVADDSIEDIQEKERRYRETIQSSDYLSGRLWADMWCAAFVWKKTRDFKYPITEEVFRRIQRNPHTCEPWMREEILRLSKQYSFFHWHLAFPKVFDDGGGFDVVLGNPPWEHVELKELEWFSARSPVIAGAPTAAARKKMIRALAESDPKLHALFLADLRNIDGERHIMRDSGLYPRCGTGRINTYAIFSELNRRLMNPVGCAGFIVPSGIATDDTTKLFFRDVIEQGSLKSLYDFENREGLFPGVHRSYKFCLLTLVGSDAPAGEAHFVFFALQVGDLREENRQFTLNASDFAMLNPNSRTCPIFRTRRDAELTKAVYARVPILWRDDPQFNSWDLEFRQGLFNLSSDSHLFRTALQLEAEGYVLKGNIFSSPFDRYLPLYEAKLHHQFDHRWSTYEDSSKTVDLTPDQKADAAFLAMPKNWVREEIVESTIPHFPELLHLAIILRETNSVQRILQLWAAGDALNREEPEEAWRLIRSAPELERHSQVATSLDRLDIESWASDLARRFPLTGDDRIRIDKSSADWIAIAEDLVARFSPRWFMGWRDICRSTDERTLIAAILPRVAIGNSTQLVLRKRNDHAGLALLLANFSSFACDYFARQKIGGTHINHQIMKQFPIFPPEFYNTPQTWQSREEPFRDWVRPRVLELTYAAIDLKAFAEDCGWNGPPFPWDEARRAVLRAELDAAYLHAYGLNREDAAYVLSATNFPIVASKHPQLFSDILDIYDAMTEAIRTGIPYSYPHLASLD